MFEIPPFIKALIFDCDGTLIDTMPLHWRAFQEVLTQFGVTCSQAELNAFAGVPTTVIVESLRRTKGWDIDPEAFAAAKELAFERCIELASEITPIAEIARQTYGKLPMAVVSGGIRDHVERSLRVISLEGCFATLVTASDAVDPKPSPEIFLLAAQRLGVAPETCLVFEDADTGLLGARRAGMHVVDVRVML